MEELAYEYYNSIEREKAAKERIQQESDMIEEAKLQQDEDWAAQMEAEELEAEEERRLEEASKPAKPPYDPSKDPNNVEWMEKVIQEEKQRLGEDFGEDLVMNFEDDE